MLKNNRTIPSNPHSLPLYTPSHLPLSHYNSRDVCFSITLCLFLFGIVGFFVGWTFSLFTRCGTFDTNDYVKQYLTSHGCLNVTNCDPQITKEAWQRANDYAIRECFVYCGYGFLIGLAVGVGFFLFYVIIKRLVINMHKCKQCYVTYDCGTQMFYIGQQGVEGWKICTTTSGSFYQQCKLCSHHNIIWCGECGKQNGSLCVEGSHHCWTTLAHGCRKHCLERWYMWYYKEPYSESPYLASYHAPPYYPSVSMSVLDLNAYESSNETSPKSLSGRSSPCTVYSVPPEFVAPPPILHILMDHKGSHEP